MSKRHQRLDTALFAALSVSSLTFWFLVGFPFANHNESFLWVGVFKQHGLADLLTKSLGLTANPRPLGTTIAWLGYRAAGESTIPQQVLNCLGAMLAWLGAFLAVRDRRLMGWVLFVVGGAFFSGYIYLFHLHGVFYSPLLLSCVLLLAMGDRRGGSPSSQIAVAGVVTAIAATFHPFALIAYVAFLVGLLIDRRRVVSNRVLSMGGALVVVSLVLARLLVHEHAVPSVSEAVSGFLVSYRMVELDHSVSLVAWVLAIASLVASSVGRRIKLAGAGAITIVSLVFLRLGLPVLVIWVVVSLLKSVWLRRWCVGALVLAMGLLPSVNPTGSPTYTIFVLMACAFVVVLGRPASDRGARAQGVAAGAALAVVVLAFLFVSAGVRVPVLCRATDSLRAERERTFQLEEVVRWMTGSELEGSRLVLLQEWGGPSESSNAVDRRYRPPTGQRYLDIYVNAMRGRPPDPDAAILGVTFGSALQPGLEEVYSVPGRYGGEAAVWREPGMTGVTEPRESR